MNEIRALSGPCFLVVGALLLTIAWRLWAGSTERRVLRLAGYLTPAGLTFLLKLRPTFLTGGLFFATQGLSSFIFWVFADKEVNNPIVAALGSMGAVWGVVTAFLAVSLWLKIWRNR